MIKESVCKQILEDIVDTYNGVWSAPSFHMVYTCGGGGGGVSVTITKERFEDTAERMGYINGYKWGVEYPTYGKKPDIMDDVLVEFKNIDFKWESYGHESDAVESWLWENSVAFKIYDERYKPKDHIVDVNKKVDTNWHERGEKPPMSEHLEFRWPDDETWFECVILPHDRIAHNGTSTGEWEVSELRIMDTIKFRPIQTHRDKAIEAAKVEIMSAKSVFRLSREDEITIEALYNTGMLKLSEDNQ